MLKLADQVRDAEIRQFVGARAEITDKMRLELPTPIGDDIETIEKHLDERDAWKEAFTATRAYYSNNNGKNSKRYRAAIKRLKEMKLIK